MGRESKAAKILREAREVIQAEIPEACEINEPTGKAPLPFPYPPTLGEVLNENTYRL